MTDIERNHHFLTDISASLSLLNLIAMLLLMVLMLFSFRELREDIKSVSRQISSGTPVTLTEDMAVKGKTEAEPDSRVSVEGTNTQEYYEALCD